jgi:hypothetical protein
MAFGDDDLEAIFSDAGEFSVLATFDVSGDPLEVYGQFTAETRTTDILSGQPVAFDNSFTCRTSDVAAVRRDTSVTIDGTTYTVKQKQDLGTGVSLVLLKT